MPTTKEFKTFDEQIAGLVGRKLKFKSKHKAKNILQKYNYFDVVNGFETILLKQGGVDKEYCYQPPNRSDTYLRNTFNHFDLFRPERRDITGRIIQRSYIDSLKLEKPYVAKYIEPPFWVVIKSLPLGSLYYTYLFLDNNIKSFVLNDFNFLPAQSKIYEQAIYIIKEVRNECAHLELITRFKLKRAPRLNNFNDITNLAGLSRSDLNYMDVLKTFKMFGSILDIKWIIIKFYIKMCIKGRRKIALKILGKMGKKDIWSWIRL